MKRFLILSFIILLPLLSHGQEKKPDGSFGFVINSGMNGEVYPIRLVPSITYFRGKSQWELGAGLHPYIHKNQRILSLEMNYKYFPNGLGNKFNMYLITHFSYVNNKLETYYPTTYNYLFLNGGYGFQINAFKGTHIGTNVSLGAFTYQNNSENPYDGFASNSLFDEFGLNLSFQFNIGYRF
jgi:hypothetical protein